MRKKLICFIFTMLIVTLTFVGCSSNKADVSKLEKQISELQAQVDKLTNEKKVSEEVLSQKNASSSEKITTVGENNQQSSKQNQTKKETVSQNQTKKETVSQNTNKYSDWIPYSTDNLKNLLSDIKKGYVVYYNGQYLASPEYLKMIENEEVHIYDVSPVSPEEGANRGILTPDTKVIYETEEEVPQDTTAP